MNERRPFGSVAAMAGVAAVAAMVGSGILGNVGNGIPSPYDSPASEVAEFFAGNTVSLLLSGLLEALTAAFIVIFAVGLLGRLRGSASHADPASLIGVVGAGVYGVMLVVVGATLFAATNLAGRGEAAEQSVVALTVLWNTLVIMLGPGGVLFLAGFGVAQLKAPGFEGWPGWLAILAGAAGLLSPLPDIVAPVSRAAANLLSLVATLQGALMYIWLLVSANRLRVRRAVEED